MAIKHEKYIELLLANNDRIFTSSELIQKICNKFKDCKRSNARKVIQNAVKKGIMKSTKPLTFGHGQYAYYSNSTPFSLKLIKDILKENRPGLYRVLERLRTNGGIISYIEALKLSASPIHKSSTKVPTFKELVTLLENMKQVKVMDCKGVNYLVTPSMSDTVAMCLMNEHNQNLYLDCIFIPPILIWLQKHYLINTKHGVVYRNKNNVGQGAIHNNLAWDAFAYTNTTGFYEYIGSNDKDTSTLVVLDFKIKGTYDLLDLYGFYDRIQIHRNSVKSKRKKRKVLPIVIANDVSTQANYEIRNLNFLSFDISTSFGERICEIIKNLELVSFNRLLNVEEDIQYDSFLKTIDNTLSTLKESGQETNLNNIKGELFERIMYMILAKIYPTAHIYHSYILTEKLEDNNIRNQEYDFFISTNNEYIAIEVKGYKGETRIKNGKWLEKENKPEKDTVKWFFSYTYPFFKKTFKVNPIKKPVRCCYITTSQFTNEALESLNTKINSVDKPDDLDIYYDGDKLIKFLKESKEHDFTQEIKVIKQYYNPVFKD